MAKPKNSDLLAERKFLRELLNLDPEESIADAVTGKLQQIAQLKATNLTLNATIDQLQGLAKELQESISRPQVFDIPQSIFEPGTVTPATEELLDIIRGKPDGPIDYARYPKPGEGPYVPPEPVLMPGQAPPLSAIHGDLTPAYCRWYLSTNGPDATRAKYGERIIHLPPDVQRALQ